MYLAALSIKVSWKFYKNLSGAARKSRIKIALAGEYGSGRFTIISDMTGDTDIGIHSDVKTDVVEKYSYSNGLDLIDSMMRAREKLIQLINLIFEKGVMP